MSQQINLYNPLLEPRREWLTLTSAALCWLLTALVVGGWAGWNFQQASSLAAQESAEKAKLVALQAEVTAKATQAAAMKRDPVLDLELSRLETDVKEREDIFTRLNSGAIGHTKGYSEYLRAFARQSMDGMWLTGFYIHGAGQDIALEGRTLHPELVPAYLRKLNRETAMKGHAFAELVMERPQGVMRAADKDKEPRLELPPFVEFRILSQPEDPGKKAATP
jgi:cell division protein FtsB